LSTGSSRYYRRLRRPSGSSLTSRSRGYRTTSLRRKRPQPPGRGGPLQFPSPPSCHSTSLTPGGPSGLQFQDLHPFHGLRPEDPGSAPPRSRPPAGTLTTRQTSLDAADWQVAPPPCGALDAGLRPDPFPGRAASLLPGLLTATRTGLPPAGNDELMLNQVIYNHLQLWTHTPDSRNPSRPPRTSNARQTLPVDRLAI
jgi:hypothetical protein